MSPRLHSGAPWLVYDIDGDTTERCNGTLRDAVRTAASIRGTAGDPFTFTEASNYVMLGELAFTSGRSMKPPHYYKEPEAALWCYGWQRAERARNG